MITVGQLRDLLAQYPNEVEVRLFTFNVPNLPAGWWHDHPVEADDMEWTPDFLRLVAES